MGLLLAAAVTFGVLLWVTVSGTLGTDAEVPADGRSHEVVVPADEERTVFVDRDAGDPRCAFVDRETGAEVERTHHRGSFTRSTQDGDWRAAWTLEPSSGRLLVTCTGEPGSAPVQIGPPVDTTRFVGGLAATILLPLALGGLGLVALIVLVVLFATGRPRREA